MRPNSETPFFYRFSRTLCCIFLVRSCFGLDTFGSIVQFWMQFLLILATEHHNLKCQFLLGLLTGEPCINLFPYLVNKKCNKNCVWAGYIFMSWRSILRYVIIWTWIQYDQNLLNTRAQNTMLNWKNVGQNLKTVKNLQVYQYLYLNQNFKILLHHCMYCKLQFPSLPCFHWNS